MVFRSIARASRQHPGAIALLVSMLGLGWWAIPGVRGFSAAVRDQARGHLEIKRYGEPALEQETYHRLMRERYGVTVNEASCQISDTTIRYIRAYNSYSERRLRARFGKDVSAECEQDAAALGNRALK